MGEVVKKLKEIRLSGERFDVELNRATSTLGEREIHIQNSSFRLAITEREFLQMCACVLLAERQLEQIKGPEKLREKREGM